AGKYTLVVGFMVEPPIEGEKNGVDFRITNYDTNQPVEGIEKTLKVEIGFKTSTTVMPLRTIFRDPGHYTADLIPTAPGQYAFRFTGAIEGLQVDERFQSGPGTFGDVASSVDLQFPDKLPALREIAGVLPATQQAATGAQETASSARTLALVASVLGGLGIVLGAGSIAMSLRKR
ncbi:MAG: hypothetical protein Q7R39_01755, partial [Dehalococcoidia bacterium]|nr:hypothetical protein [Dehalococcoidia bacterium]